jgi:hypothetical protein
MRIVDESGRLFGRVNVFDAAIALVVLAALAIAIAGAGGALVGSPADTGEPATRYATVDLGGQSSDVAARLSAGDTATAGSAANLTITDTYVGPAAGDNVSVHVRVRVNGTLAGAEQGRVFQYGDDPLGRGDDLAIETAAYEVDGEVTKLETENDSLATRTLPVLVEADLSPSAAAHVERNDTYRLANRTVATVTGTVITPATGRANRTALVSLSLRTIRRSGQSYFGETRIAVGRSVPFRTNRYALSGSVARWGDVSPPGEPATVTTVVKLEDVDPEVADGFEAGMTERRGGTAIAEIGSVRTEPASVVVTTDAGEIYERDHPRNRDVYLTVELRVRRTDDGLRFRTRPLREGSTVTLDFATVVADGTVVDVER